MYIFQIGPLVLLLLYPEKDIQEQMLEDASFCFFHDYEKKQNKTQSLAVSHVQLCARLYVPVTEAPTCTCTSTGR